MEILYGILWLLPDAILVSEKFSLTPNLKDRLAALILEKYT